MMNLEQLREVVVESSKVGGNTIEQMIEVIDNEMVKCIKEYPHNNWWKVAHSAELMTKTQCYNYLKAFREAVGVVYDVDYTVTNRVDYVLVFTLTREMLGLEKGDLK